MNTKSWQKEDKLHPEIREEATNFPSLLPNKLCYECTDPLREPGNKNMLWEKGLKVKNVVKTKLFITHYY
jgi:hypothetical protein